MAEFTVGEMLEMQRKLRERYKDVWLPLTPETGKDHLLWMIGEVGEVIDIVKKNGGRNAAENAELKAHLVEEMADVLMYYGDVMLCYDISEDELKRAYTDKFEKNMTRWKA
ncbi:MAG: MazG-like family protein [Blautia sp.]|nr:MazG-like family protein [Blautia sp.]